MNKKKFILMSLLPIFLLTACPKNEKEDDFDYNTTDTSITFDYTKNAALQDSLSHIHFENDGDVDSDTLNKFLGILSLNDFYANELKYSSQKTVAYIDKNGDYLANDVNYSIQKNIVRDNEKNSLSGSVTISDEKWTANEEDPTIVDHTKVNTTGSYSLVPNVEKEIGDEIIDCDNDAYDSKKTVGYSSTNWGNKMNLTQSAEIGSKFLYVLETVEERNNSVPDANKFKTTIKSKKDADSLTITLISKATQPTSAERNHIFEETYLVSVTVLSGMVSNTKYQYTQIEKTDADIDLVVLAEMESRVLSHTGA